jgi:hypothetical protein
MKSFLPIEPFPKPLIAAKTINCWRNQIGNCKDIPKTAFDSVISLSIFFFCNMIKEKEINITFINQSNVEEK